MSAISTELVMTMFCVHLHLAVWIFLDCWMLSRCQDCVLLSTLLPLEVHSKQNFKPNVWTELRLSAPFLAASQYICLDVSVCISTVLILSFCTFVFCFIFIQRDEFTFKVEMRYKNLLIIIFICNYSLTCLIQLQLYSSWCWMWPAQSNTHFNVINRPLKTQ